MFYSVGAVALLGAVDLVSSSLVTPAPSPLPTRGPDLRYARDFQRREDSLFTVCDGVGNFACRDNHGYCYGGTDGYIGCCSESSCAPRTKCVASASKKDQAEAASSHNLGGYVICSQSAAPNCVQITNVVMDQYIMYCDAKTSGTFTTSYSGIVLALSSTGSVVSSTSSSSSSSSSSSASSPSTSSSSPSVSVSTVTASTPAPAATPPTQSKPSKSIPAGSTAGIVIGVATVLVIVIAVCFFHRKRPACLGRLRKVLPFSRRKDRNSQYHHPGPYAGNDLTGNEKLPPAISGSTPPSIKDPNTSYSEIEGRSIDPTTVTGVSNKMHLYVANPDAETDTITPLPSPATIPTPHIYGNGNAQGVSPRSTLSSVSPRVVSGVSAMGIPSHSHSHSNSASGLIAGMSHSETGGISHGTVPQIEAAHDPYRFYSPNGEGLGLGDQYAHQTSVGTGAGAVRQSWAAGGGSDEQRGHTIQSGDGYNATGGGNSDSSMLQTPARPPPWLSPEVAMNEGFREHPPALCIANRQNGH